VAGEVLVYRIIYGTVRICRPLQPNSHKRSGVAIATPDSVSRSDAFGRPNHMLGRRFEIIETIAPVLLLADY
jgi:hypothetical protein